MKLLLSAIFVLLMSPANSAPDCLSLREARAQYPKDHLYSHRGCWDAKRAMQRIKKIPVPDLHEPGIPTDAPAIGNEIATTDANAMYVYDWFDAPRERFIIYALKEDRAPIRRVDNFPIAPLQENIDRPQSQIEQPVLKAPLLSRSMSWAIFAVGFFAIALSMAYLIHRARDLLPPSVREYSNGSRRNVNVIKSSSVARSDRTHEAIGKRASAGSDGARDQQSHFHSGDIYRWVARTDLGGYAFDPQPPPYRRDDVGALGAWARSRGLCPSSSINHTDTGQRRSAIGGTDRSASAGWTRKRFAFFTRR